MKQEITAVVLSGGGNRGAMQAGALLALFERGLKVDMLVGTSAGSMNASFLAADPSFVQAQHLCNIWRHIRKQDVFPGNRLRMAWRVLRGQPSLFANEQFLRHVLNNLPPHIKYFRDLKDIQLYTVAAHQATGVQRVFGDDPDERLVDAIMASTAVPPFLPPWCIDDECLVDGAIATNLPISVAIDHGATEVWAIEIAHDVATTMSSENILGHMARSITAVLSCQAGNETALLPPAKGHLIQLHGFEDLTIWDYCHTEAMIEAGYQQASEQLGQQPIISKEVKVQNSQASIVKYQSPMSSQSNNLDRWAIENDD